MITLSALVNEAKSEEERRKEKKTSTGTVLTLVVCTAG